MDVFLQNLGWKKAGLLLIGVAVMGFAIIFLLMITTSVPESNNTVPDNLADYEPTATSAPENTSEQPTQRPRDVVEQWVRYDSATYAVFHPQSFAPEERTEDDGKLTVFLPDYGDSDFTQRIEVQESTLADGSYNNVISALKDSGLSEDTAVIDENVAPRFKGLVGGYFRQTTVVYQKNNTLYQISLFYPSSQEYNDLEKLFDTFTAGFRVK